MCKSCFPCNCSCSASSYSAVEEDASPASPSLTVVSTAFETSPDPRVSRASPLLSKTLDASFLANGSSSSSKIENFARAGSGATTTPIDVTVDASASASARRVVFGVPAFVVVIITSFHSSRTVARVETSRRGRLARVSRRVVIIAVIAVIGAAAVVVVVVVVVVIPRPRLSSERERERDR